MRINGKLIADARKQRGMTQTELAGVLHVSKNTIYNWENNRTEVSPRTVVQLADILGLVPSTITVEDEPRGLGIGLVGGIAETEPAPAPAAEDAAPEVPEEPVMTEAERIAAEEVAAAEKAALQAADDASERAISAAAMAIESKAPWAPQQGDLLKMRAEGSSMEPEIMHGDEVWYEPYNGKEADVPAGSVVVAEWHKRKIVRCLTYSGDSPMLCGWSERCINIYRRDEEFRVIGIVKKIVREPKPMLL